MSSNKLSAGDKFPVIKVQNLGDEYVQLGTPKGNADWQLIVVYRGKHCPLCTKYLAQLENLKNQFIENGIDILVVSADIKEKAKEQTKDELNLSIDVAYGLSIEQMKELGLYISHPRSPEETDHPFPEPGIFVVNENNQLHIVDVSNNPFVRPDLNQLLAGLKWLKDPKNNYPIRGTYK